MPTGFYGLYGPPTPSPLRVGRPDRGDRAKVKAGRKSARAARRRR